MLETFLFPWVQFLPLNLVALSLNPGRYGYLCSFLSLHSNKCNDKKIREASLFQNLVNFISKGLLKRQSSFIL